MKRKGVWAVVLPLLALLILSACQLVSQSSGEPTNANAETDQSPNLAPFTPIYGTPYMLGEVYSTEAPYSFSSGSERRVIYNYVFLDTTTLASHRLFSSNESLIINIRTYPEPPNPNDRWEPQPTEPVVTQWIVYEVIQADTNGDGALNFEDAIAIGITDASGNDYAEVLTDFGRTFTMAYVDPNRLIVVSTASDDESDAKTAYAIDLQTRTVLASKPIIYLGADAQ